MKTQNENGKKATNTNTENKKNNTKKENTMKTNTNTNTTEAAKVVKTKAQRLAEAAEAARRILSDPKKYRYHSAAALRLAVATSNAAKIVELLRSAIAEATKFLPANGVITLCALKVEAIPSEIVEKCARIDGSITAAPLLRFMASDSVEAEAARIRGAKEAEAKAARKARKEAKAKEKAEAEAKKAPK